MIHELLLALLGNTGNIFVKKDDDSIRVLSDLPFLHQTEEAILFRLCNLASHYSVLKCFIQKYGHNTLTGIQSLKGPHGMYICAFCAGLDKVLHPYRAHILKLEQDFLEDPHLTACHIQSELEQYQLLLPALVGLVENINTHNIHGCHILEIVHKASLSGLPIVQQAFLRILHICHGVLYKQLASWMIHGTLQDRYSELFIGPTSDRNTSECDLSVSSSNTWSSSGDHASVQQALEILKITDKCETNRQFCIVAAVLPSYIPLRVAEKILFVGESVQLFEKDPYNTGKAHIGSIYQNKEREYSKCLHELSLKPEFNLMSFEAIIDEIKTFVSEQLWKLVVEKANLIAQLRIIKDFFLLGRGELYLAFIHQVEDRLQKRPAQKTEHEINMAFQQASRDVLFEDDDLIQKFKLVLDKPKESTQKMDITGWSCLRLTYTIDWPLHILFMPGVLERYNTLHQYLLHIKRVQLKLQQLWTLQKYQQIKVNRSDSGAAWWLRYHMAFLVDSFQYYLQVDVIESQFSILLDKINSMRDFEAIRFAHEHFLTSLLSQAFLLSKPVSICLHNILDLCHQFVHLYREDLTNPSEQQKLQFDTISKSFSRQSKMLFQMLSSVRSHQSSSHLAQLLLRLDFNKYFSGSGGLLGR